MKKTKTAQCIRIPTSILFILVFHFFTTGCQMPGDRYAPQVITPAAITYLNIGTSIQGRPVECIQFGRTGPTSLVIAAIHGNEPASRVLADALKEYLIRNRYLYSRQRILLIPTANPDGLAAGTRENARQIDLNRNFPSDNRLNNDQFGQEPLSEPESRALYQLIETEKPVRILSIHQPYGCIDFDGPGKILAQRMALWCPLPIQKIGALPGSLGSWAGETKGIPTITFEMKAEDTLLTQDQLWAKYGKAVLDFLTAP
jgi:protein MpaA